MYLQPGFLCLPAKPTLLCTVVASGVAVTMFDRLKGLGSMGHYSHPRRLNGKSTPIFAAPALVEMINMFTAAGSEPGDIETFVYGGSDNPGVRTFDPGRAIANLRAGFEILEKLGVRVSGSDIGGRFARKLVFYTGTGESMVAKVAAIRSSDWYPDPRGLARP
jgi:Chemotaxis protein; stimulates methylation of MCP proteins